MYIDNKNTTNFNRDSKSTSVTNSNSTATINGKRGRDVKIAGDISSNRKNINTSKVNRERYIIMMG